MGRDGDRQRVEKEAHEIERVGPEDLHVVAQLYNQIFKPARDQEAFLANVRAAGGLGLAIHSIQELVQALEGS